MEIIYIIKVFVIIIILGSAQSSYIDDKLSDLDDSQDIESAYSAYVKNENYLDCVGNDENKRPEPCEVRRGGQIVTIPRGPPILKKDKLIEKSGGHRGDKHELRCQHEACPPAKVAWFKDGVQVRPREYSNEKMHSSIEISSKGKLTIKFNREEDDGDYTCVVYNQCGSVNHTITVHSEVIQRNDGPHIKEELRNQTVLIGSNLTLTCEPKVPDPGNPVDISWYRIDKVNESYVDAIKLETSTFATELFLENLQVHNSSWYQCRLKNFWGDYKSAAFINVVESLPTSKTGMIFSIVAGVLGIIILGCCVVMGFCYKKSRKSERDKQLAIENAKKVACWTKKVLVNREITTEDQLHPRIFIEKIRTEIRTQNGEAPSPHSEYEFPEDPKWEFPRSSLNLLDVLGEGAFGRVKLATAQAVIRNGLLVPDSNVFKENEIKVAVKMLKEGHTDSDVTDLYSELEIMKRIGCHPNIINLLGECSQPAGQPLLVIVEYAPFGNLRQFLRDRKPGTKDHLMVIRNRQVEKDEIIRNDYLQLQNSGGSLCSDPVDLLFPVSLKMMLSFALQVSRGMEFLSSRRCVHRDLAARNVLVADGLVLKIADFGMARDIQENDYYRKVSDGRLPIKWMAPESLLSRVSTTMSDVWSFGILFWEIVTFGDTPYKNELSPKVFMELIKSGYKMKQPHGCPDSVYTIMKRCWEFMPENRPGWRELVSSLYDLHTNTDPDKYLDLSLPGVETPPDTPQSSCSKERTVPYSGVGFNYYDQESEATKTTGFASNGTYDRQLGTSESMRPLLHDMQHEMETPRGQIEKQKYIQICADESEDENSVIEGRKENMNYAAESQCESGITEYSCVANTPISLSDAQLTPRGINYQYFTNRNSINTDTFLASSTGEFPLHNMVNNNNQRRRSISETINLPKVTNESERLQNSRTIPPPIAAKPQIFPKSPHNKQIELRRLNRPAPLMIPQRLIHQPSNQNSSSPKFASVPTLGENLNSCLENAGSHLVQNPPSGRNAEIQFEPANMMVQDGMLYVRSPRCSCADNQNFTWSPVPIPISWSPGQGPGTGPISWSPGQGPVSGTEPVSWSPGTVLPATGISSPVPGQLNWSPGPFHSPGPAMAGWPSDNIPTASQSSVYGQDSVSAVNQENQTNGFFQNLADKRKRATPEENQPIYPLKELKNIENFEYNAAFTRVKELNPRGSRQEEEQLSIEEEQLSIEEDYSGYLTPQKVVSNSIVEFPYETISNVSQQIQPALARRQKDNPTENVNISTQQGKVYTKTEVYNETNEAYTEHGLKVYNDAYKNNNASNKNDIHRSQTMSNYFCNKDVTAESLQQLYNRRESTGSTKLEKRDSSESGYQTKRTSRESSE